MSVKVRFLDCLKHGPQPSPVSDRCMICLQENRALHEAYVAAHHALMQRVEADECRTPFPERKNWPEWITDHAASDAFLTAVPRLTKRTVQHERKTENKRETCGSACLNGKRACSCLCGGFCHGAGKCMCNTPEARAWRQQLHLEPHTRDAPTVVA